MDSIIKKLIIRVIYRLPNSKDIEFGLHLRYLALLKFQKTKKNN